MILEGISVVIAIIISVVKFLMKFKATSKKELKNGYKFVEKIIAKDKWKKMHDYSLEKAYLISTGKQLEASVIRFFLKQKDPSKKLSDYNRGSRFLLSQRKEDKVIRINLIDSLVDEKKFKWALWSSTGIFIISSVLIIAPFAIFPNLLSYDVTFLSVLAVWVCLFVMLMFSAVKRSLALESAKRISLLSF